MTWKEDSISPINIGWMVESGRITRASKSHGSDESDDNFRALVQYLVGTSLPHITEASLGLARTNGIVLSFNACLYL